MIASALAAFGHLDIVVNNAQSLVYKSVRKITEDDMNSMWQSGPMGDLARYAGRPRRAASESWVRDQSQLGLVDSAPPGDERVCDGQGGDPGADAGYRVGMGSGGYPCERHLPAGRDTGMGVLQGRDPRL